MKELEQFYIPNVIRAEEVDRVLPDPETVEKVEELLTPQDILDRLEFDRPEVIMPLKYPNFDILLKDRDRIRSLQLLPVKTDDQYIYYHQQPKEYLLQKILDNLGSSNLMLAANAYPYLLPEDLGQYIVWAKNWEVENKLVIDFIARCLKHLNLKQDEVILFERPLSTKSKLVKGTFGQLRHIHFWFKIRGADYGVRS